MTNQGNNFIENVALILQPENILEFSIIMAYLYFLSTIEVNTIKNLVCFVELPLLTAINYKLVPHTSAFSASAYFTIILFLVPGPNNRWTE